MLETCNKDQQKLHNMNFTLNQTHHICSNPSVAMTTARILTLTLELPRTNFPFLCVTHESIPSAVHTVKIKTSQIQKALNDEIFQLSEKCAVITGHRRKSHIYTMTGCHLLNVTTSSIKENFILIFHKAFY
jgi:hypothetical protein